MSPKNSQSSYFSVSVRQSNIQLTCYIPGGNSVKTRLRCSLLNCDYTLQVLQQVATNDYKTTGRCIPKTVSCGSLYIIKYKRLDSLTPVQDPYACTLHFTY